MKRALSLKPHEILQDPLLNKGSAFTKEERDSLKLHGFLPDHISSVEEQIARNYNNFSMKKTPIGKYAFLTDLLNRNEILFYQFAAKYLEEIMPIIYTPTVGEASIEYSLIFKERRGLYLSYPLQDKIEQILQNVPSSGVDVIVVTDGERILGLGDLGIGGMAIPIGKLALYILLGGFHPAKTLPILLDVGTNNKELRSNPLYLGWRNERISGDSYYSFIDKFVQAIKKRFPEVLLQWEDFGKGHAEEILTRYREKILSFNDDIQGTAASALGALYSASKKAGVPYKNHKIVILGGGSAGMGIARMLQVGLMKEGLSEQEAIARIFIVDVQGLLHHQLPNLTPAQKPFAKSLAELTQLQFSADSPISLLQVIKHVSPTVLIGVCAQRGAFTEEIVKEMAKRTSRPIIFPLSNPTSKSEAFPEELIPWTNGKAIIATGSPFQPYEYQGKKYQIGQCNNVYLYPAVGLGTKVSNAKVVTDAMFWTAAKALADNTPHSEDETASLFPEIKDLKPIIQKIAAHVAMQAVKEKVAPTATLSEIEKRIKEFVWEPKYDTFTS